MARAAKTLTYSRHNLPQELHTISTVSRHTYQSSDDYCERSEFGFSRAVESYSTYCLYSVSVFAAVHKAALQQYSRQRVNRSHTAVKQPYVFCSGFIQKYVKLELSTARRVCKQYSS